MDSGSRDGVSLNELVHKIDSDRYTIDTIIPYFVEYNPDNLDSVCRILPISSGKWPFYFGIDYSLLTCKPEAIVRN